MTTPTVSRRLLAALLLIGLALRLWYWLQVRDTYLFTTPYLDCRDYDQWARALIAGDWGQGQPYWIGPLYPHLLALSYAVFGAGSPAMMLGQWALTLLNIVLVYQLGRRWAGESTGLVAAAIFAGYGPPVFYAGFRLMTTLVTTLVLLISLQADNAARSPTRRSWLLLGLLVGLAATARGNVLALLPILPPVLLAGRHLGARRVWRLTALLWLGAALAVLPVTARNAVIGGDLVLLTSNAGLNLLIGQQDQYGGRFGTLSETTEFEFDPTGESVLETELGHDLSASEVSDELTRQALARVAREPGAMVAHYGRKAYRFWSGYELPQIFSWNFWRGRHLALQLHPVPFVLLSALGLAGAAALPSLARRLWLAIVGGWFLGLLPFFPTARYRQPLAPLLAITTAAWLMAMFAAWRGGDRRRSLILGTAGLALVVALWPTWSAFDPADETWHSHLARAFRATEAGDRRAMLAACADAEETHPGRAETLYRQGGYLTRLGDLPSALAAYAEAVRRLPDSAFVLYQHARTLAALGRHEEALAGYAAAAAADPNWSFPWHGRALSLKELGQLEAAAAALTEAIARDPGRARYRSNLASLLGEMGRLDEAATILEELTRAFPDYLPGWFNLAMVQARGGDNTAARRTLEKVAALPRLTSEEREQIDRLRRHLDAGNGSAVDQ